MNSDLISRQAAIDAAREELESGTYFDIPSKIEALPSAQPQIIRCKECKYYDPNDHCYLQGAEANDFCSYAERRTDEQTD